MTGKSGIKNVKKVTMNNTNRHVSVQDRIDTCRTSGASPRSEYRRTLGSSGD